MQVIHTLNLFKDSKIASSEKNDCTVATLASSFDIPYDEAHSLAETLFKRQPRKGPMGPDVISAMAKVHHNRININGKTVTKIYCMPTKEYKCNGKIVNRRTRVKSFIKDHPQGTYFMIVKGHALTVKDGVMIDNFRKGSGSKVIYRAYEIK